MTDGFELMRHALGVQTYDGRRWRRPYRNHFVASGDHIGIWDDLVAKGFAMKTAGSELTGGDPVYYVTDAGIAAALSGITYKRVWGYGMPTKT